MYPYNLQNQLVSIFPIFGINSSKCVKVMMKMQLLIICFAMIFMSCQDKQTQQNVKTNTETIKVKKLKTTNHLLTKEEKPLITQEDVVEFLTEYGKKHPETKLVIETRYGNIQIELFMII